jgi:hypothetical protein
MQIKELSRRLTPFVFPPYNKTTTFRLFYNRFGERIEREAKGVSIQIDAIGLSGK